MENVYDLIINGLVKGGYAEKEAEELISKFVEEQKQLDKIKDYFQSLIN